MLNIIKDEKSLKKDKELYLWKSYFEAEMDEEEYLKKKDFLENRVRLLEKEISMMDLQKLLGEKEVKLNFQKKVKQEALENFDDYWKEMKEEEEKRIEEEKDFIKQFLENFELVKKIELEKLEETERKRLESYQAQLDDAKSRLAEYEITEED